MGSGYIKALGGKYLMGNYTRQPMALVKGSGAYVWDADGNQFLDFVGGLAVNALGHCHPRVTEAITNQCARIMHCSNLYWIDTQVELAQLLVENSCLDRVFFCNSGTEANEAAIKLARRYFQVVQNQDRYKIITMSRSFHGRTLAAAAATAQEAIHSGFDPLPQGFCYVPLNDLGALEKGIDDATCAVMLEPLQGEGGINAASKEYLQGAAELCKEKGVLLILDEIQCGMGRTGRLFAHEHYDVKPDIVTLAKALGGGIPIGALLASDAVSGAFGPGSHGSTFGGNPVSCAAAVAVMEALLNEGVIDNAQQVGAYLKEKLAALAAGYDFIKEVRGMGLMLGMELVFPGADIVDACRDKGLLINCTVGSVLRFLPPLNITEKHVDEAVAILGGVFDRLPPDWGEE